MNESVDREMTRRGFIYVTAAAGALTTAGPFALAADPGNGIPMRPLGRTGVRVSSIGLGGFHIGNVPEEAAAVDLVRRAIDGGITFMDNCWDYHDGASELRMGKALRDGYRDRVFLMTKIDGRTRQSAAEQIDASLKRLQVDHVDLLQFHEIIRVEDADTIWAPGGAFEAVEAARQAGKLRFIGFTGHKDPFIHLRMLENARKNRVRFDAVQLPLNVMDAHFRSFERQVLPILVREQIGVLGMKPLGGGVILKSGTATAPECLRYALHLPTSTVITGIESAENLDQALTAARTFQPLKPDERAELLARTEEAAAQGQFELFKTATRFDATARNPEWLGYSKEG